VIVHLLSYKTNWSLNSVWLSASSLYFALGCLARRANLRLDTAPLPHVCSHLECPYPSATPIYRPANHAIHAIIMTHRLSLSTTPSNTGFSGYMANASSPQPSATSTASGVTTGGTTELATFYIHSALHCSGQFFHVNKPADIPNTPPVAIKRPKFPEMRQLSMRMLTPCIFYVQYPCEQKCRNLGICIHYQFVVGCKKCPDGLRCEVCVGSGVEEVGSYPLSPQGEAIGG
jgi:hypothetical protein